MATTAAAAAAFLARPAARDEAQIFSSAAAGTGRRISLCPCPCPCPCPDGGYRRRSPASVSAALEKSNGGGKKVGSGVPNSNYVVPLDKAMAGLTRPLAEILRDLNKRVPDKIINPEDNSIPWYHVNRMLSFYAPGWCGEVRDVIYSDNGTVTVVYRVTIQGSDGQAHRESTATMALNDGEVEDPVAAAEEMAFCRACARFGFGLYLYHEEEIM